MKPSSKGCIIGCSGVGNIPFLIYINDLQVNGSVLCPSNKSSHSLPAFSDVWIREGQNIYTVRSTCRKRRLSGYRLHVAGRLFAMSSNPWGGMKESWWLRWKVSADSWIQHIALVPISTKGDSMFVHILSIGYNAMQHIIILTVISSYHINLLFSLLINKMTTRIHLNVSN